MPRFAEGTHPATGIAVEPTRRALFPEAALGAVREVVSREIRRLAREGMIAPLSGGRYRLLDARALRTAADG